MKVERRCADISTCGDYFQLVLRSHDHSQGGSDLPKA